MNNKNITKILIVIIVALIIVIVFLSFKLYKANKYIKNNEIAKCTYHTAVLKWKADSQDNKMQECIEVFTYDDENVITPRTIITFLNEELANNHYNGLDKEHYSAEVNANIVTTTESIEKGIFKKEVVFSVISEYENQKEQDSGELTYEIY